MTKIDFGLGGFNIEDATAEMRLPWLNGNPVLIVRPATDANPDYSAEVLRLNAGRDRHPGEDTPEDRVRDREHDREIYPRVVVVGWRDVRDVAGNDVEFSVDAATEFFAQLPVWIINRIRVFCMRAENFIKRGDDPDPAALAGKS